MEKRRYKKSKVCYLSSHTEMIAEQTPNSRREILAEIWFSCKEHLKKMSTEKKPPTQNRKKNQWLPFHGYITRNEGLENLNLT